MHLPRTILLSVLSATIGARAQYSDNSYVDITARSLDDGDGYLADLLYAREADADAEIDPDTHLMITRDLHARVADLEEAFLFPRQSSGGSSSHGGSSGNKSSSGGESSYFTPKKVASGPSQAWKAMDKAVKSGSRKQYKSKPVGWRGYPI